MVRNPILSRKKEELCAVSLTDPANRQGRMVAHIIYGEDRRYKGTYGVRAVRVFGHIAACVGMSEKLLSANGLPRQTFRQVVNISSRKCSGFYHVFDFRQ